jgi:hypothetical protein
LSENSDNRKEEKAARAIEYRSRVEVDWINLHQMLGRLPEELAMIELAQ